MCIQLSEQRRATRVKQDEQAGGVHGGLNIKEIRTSLMRSVVDFSRFFLDFSLTNRSQISSLQLVVD